MFPIDAAHLRDITNRKEETSIRLDILYIEGTALVEAYNGFSYAYFNHYGKSVLLLAPPVQVEFERRGFTITQEPTDKFPHRWKLSW